MFKFGMYELGLDCFMLRGVRPFGVLKGGPYLAGGGGGAAHRFIA